MTTYHDFLARKVVRAQPAGLGELPELSPALFPHQRAVTEFLLRSGRGGAFLDTGLGKTLIELEWSRVVAEHTGRPVIAFTPLAVAPQIAREAAAFDIGPVRVVRDQSEVGPGLNLANYERLHRFTPSMFGGVSLDESSILKSFAGKTTRALIRAFAETPFRLGATATPAPNDHTELGQHAEFLGVMPASEMLSRWFITDQAAMGRYRLKGHAVRPFWRWVASWARCLSRPSDLGFSDEAFVLPELIERRHEVRADVSQDTGGMLFRLPDTSATSIHKEKRLTAAARGGAAAEIVRADAGEPWVIWVETDYEAEAVRRALPEAVEVKGSQSTAEKERRLVAFSAGEIRVLLTKPSIAGFGLNWQHCARMVFVGLSFSYEGYYQAVRRCWRFGQRRPVEAHAVVADTERATIEAVRRKAAEHERMQVEMAAAMRAAGQGAALRVDHAAAAEVRLPAWLREREDAAA